MRTSVVRRRLAPLVSVAAVVVLATALPAAAHVTVDSQDAEPGEFGKVVFRIPNESETADTTRVQVSLPAATPFAFVSTKTQPGWTVKTRTAKLDKPVKTAGFTITEAVRTITWSAKEGSAVPPGQFMEFEVSGGPFPSDVARLPFPTTQTYSDGEVVAWDDVAKDGAAEPEHPAPVLELGAAADDTQPVATTSSPSQAATAGSDDGDGVARTLATIALLLAAGALAWSIISGRKAHR